MGTVSNETAEIVKDFGVAIDRSTTIGEYTINFVSIRETTDLGPMLASLPGGNCPCPHWGYMITGRMIVRYDDHEEIVNAGDAFYMSPGHAPEAEAGSEFVQFSPADQLAAVDAALAAAMQARSKPSTSN